MATARQKKAPANDVVQHDIVRGVWQLCRFHTPEALSTTSIGWLALFFYAIQQQIPFELLRTTFFGILASFYITHGVFCMWNVDQPPHSDICDRNFDGKVARTKKRPLPSGMITYPEAMVAFIIGFAASIGVTYATMGRDVTLAMGPAWFLSYIYPLCKRHIWAPQVVLGITMAVCVIPPWVALGNGTENIELPISLIGAVFSWLVYLDLIYASQDSPDDKKAGVKSLAVFLGDKLKPCLTILGGLQVYFFVRAAQEAAASQFVWFFGIAVWAVSVPWSIASLDPRDRDSGGRIFLVNAFLSIYLAAVTGADVWFSY
ncbi:UbiA-like polyprenyl transferase NtnF [Paramyrothecium foliicola]|nr:UbiA-like polyprenyl transferase NtnF [Paramyrothecium foliicola]